MTNRTKTSLVLAVSFVLMTGCSSENSGNASAEGKSPASSTEKSSSSGAPSIKKSNLVLDLNKDVDSERIELYASAEKVFGNEYSQRRESHIREVFPEKYLEIGKIKDVIDKDEALKKLIEDLKKLREESLEGAKVVRKDDERFRYEDGKIIAGAPYLFNSLAHDLKIEPSSKEDLKKLANDEGGYIEVSGTLYFMEAPKDWENRFVPGVTDIHIEVFDKDNKKIDTAKISYKLEIRDVNGDISSDKEMSQ